MISDAISYLVFATTYCILCFVFCLFVCVTSAAGSPEFPSG